MAGYFSQRRSMRPSMRLAILAVAFALLSSKAEANRIPAGLLLKLQGEGALPGVAVRAADGDRVVELGKVAHKEVPAARFEVGRRARYSPPPCVAREEAPAARFEVRRRARYSPPPCVAHKEVPAARFEVPDGLRKEAVSMPAMPGPGALVGME
jgi:hypothetical protein